MAERYLYLPLRSVLPVWGCADSQNSGTCSKGISSSCEGMLCRHIHHSSLTHTIRNNRIWFDKQTLWYYTVFNTSCSFNAHNNLGKEYYEKGLLDKAIEEYTIALSKASEVRYAYPIAHYNLGIAYDEKGMFDASIQEYRNALRIEPKNSDTHNNLAITLLRMDRLTWRLKNFVQQSHKTQIIQRITII